MEGAPVDTAEGEMEIESDGPSGDVATGSMTNGVFVSTSVQHISNE